MISDDTCKECIAKPQSSSVGCFSNAKQLDNNLNLNPSKLKKSYITSCNPITHYFPFNFKDQWPSDFECCLYSTPCELPYDNNSNNGRPIDALYIFAAVMNLAMIKKKLFQATVPIINIHGLILP
jgi:hypothetical protein